MTQAFVPQCLACNSRPMFGNSTLCKECIRKDETDTVAAVPDLESQINVIEIDDDVSDADATSEELAAIKAKEADFVLAILSQRYVGGVSEIGDVFAVPREGLGGHDSLTGKVAS